MDKKFPLPSSPSYWPIRIALISSAHKYSFHIFPPSYLPSVAIELVAKSKKCVIFKIVCVLTTCHFPPCTFFVKIYYTLRKKISSIRRFQKSMRLRNVWIMIASLLPICMFAYGGAILVPMLVPSICK